MKTTAHRPLCFAGRRRCAGVTLVEVVAMLLVLAVLAAVALPRYADAQSRAREARVRSAATSMQAVASLVHANAQARGSNCDVGRQARLEIDGTTIALEHCYPQPLADFADGILGAARLQPEGWVATVRNDGGAPLLVLEASEALTPGQCSVSYNTPRRAGEGVLIATLLSGC